MLSRLPLSRLDAWLARRRVVPIVLALAALSGGVGFARTVAGPGELTPALFYIVSVLFAARYAGRTPGALFAVLGALAWLWSDLRSPGGYAHGSTPYWNAVLLLVVLSVVAALVAALQTQREHAQELARTDALTGVPNARAFYELAAAELTRAQRYPHPFSVAYLDVDDFRLVNERLGHSAGDAVLRSVARALRSTLRASDVVARMGGDEFAVLLPESGSAPTRLAVEKLRQALADMVPAHGWRLSASIGVATFLVPPDSVDALLEAADSLMDRAKQGGKNTVAHETRNEAPALR
jgi:diguanylate cyclase (GGDEF)-like protein